jgi:hypothetical protein
MSLPGIVPGIPGLRQLKTATHKIVFREGWDQFYGLGKLIDGNNARDPTNSPPDSIVLQPGLLMGKISAATGDVVAGTVGVYGASIIDVLQGAIASAATSLTLTPAGAAEVVRRFGSSGTFLLTGPPIAGGTVASQVITYSSVNTSTGVITITAAPAAFIAGSLVQPQDGSQNILSLIPDGYGVLVTDNDFSTPILVQFPEFPIAGVLLTANIINYPTDTSLKAYVRNALSSTSGGKFVFDEIY